MDTLCTSSRQASPTTSTPASDAAPEYSIGAFPATSLSNAPEGVHRVHRAAGQIALDCRFVEVPSDYYSWTLEQRRERLGAPSVHHLCKSIILENTACTKVVKERRVRRLVCFADDELQTDCSDRKNSRFYTLVINYTSRLHSHKVALLIRRDRSSYQQLL